MVLHIRKCHATHDSAVFALKLQLEVCQELWNQTMIITCVSSHSQTLQPIQLYSDKMMSSECCGSSHCHRRGLKDSTQSPLQSSHSENEMKSEVPLLLGVVLRDLSLLVLPWDVRHLAKTKTKDKFCGEDPQFNHKGAGLVKEAEKDKRREERQWPEINAEGQGSSWKNNGDIGKNPRPDSL